MITSAATRSGCLSANVVSVCAPIEAPASTALVDLAVVEHGEQVGRQPVVAVVVAAVGLAVGARVVGDHAMAGALERPRAHHDVAPRRGQAVQQDDRRALAVLGA